MQIDRSHSINLTSMTSTINLVELPEDLITDILLRLCVKTLLCLKCVCKRLKALIESPDFVNRHFLHETNQEHLFLRHYRTDESKYTYALYSDETFSQYDEPEHLQMPSSVASLMGPVNGIFCVVSASGKIGLLNPALRWFKPLHFVRQQYHPDRLTPCDHSFGFGVDPVSQRYKVILIQYFWDEETDEPHGPCLVSIYNSGTNTWRHIEDSEFCAWADRSMCYMYMNGAYYWFLDREDSDGGVLVFDMSSEAFQEVKAPEGLKTREVDLAPYGDSIALISCGSDRRIDVWVMEETQGGGCWNKILAMVGPLVDMKWPLGFWNKSEILFETKASVLTLYDVCTKKTRTVQARRRENGFFLYWVFSYKESLVTLDRDCYYWDPSSYLIQQLLS